MQPKKSSRFLLFLRRNFKKFEALLFIGKDFLSERHFLYLSCVVVAISCSFAVIVLKGFAHSVFILANYVNGYLKLPYINSILPIVGILLTVFVIKNLLDGSLEKGSSRILYAVAKKGGILPRKQMYAQIITSSLTVGLGGSAGLESPITITGAAFGSNFAQKYKLSKKDRILLLACGVSSGIAAAFNAPIAGVLFAIEVVLTDVAITAFIPIMISAATGALVSTIVLNEDVLLSFKEQQTFDYHNIPVYVLLGILAGFVSVYHARNFQKIEHYFSKIKNAPYKKALFGASILAILIFFFPTLFGEGYESIKALSNSNPQQILDNTLLDEHKSNEWILLAFVGITMMLKVFATALTLGSGGNGGNFAPSLFVGSYLGFFTAKFINLLGITKPLPVGNFTIVGMAGILAGLFHAPLTAIFLIGEITGGYGLMVPLMIVSSISFAVSKQLEPHSMDIKHLADKGDVFTSDKDKNILSAIDILQHINTHYNTIKISDKIEKILEHLTNSKQDIFPVVNDQNQLIGLITMEHLKPIIFNSFRTKYTSIEEIMQTNPVTISYDESIETVMEMFENSYLTQLPVLKNGTFHGFIYKTDLLETYRKKLREMVIE
ncbi:CBS domain-containing protein [Flavobacterium sp. NST-5]|uniref:CBS domain-containing protein n=1 Tax=Flavobacterium ichthyis TaxID=2698827 RepID=A0ABW9ZED5_9FLAO|nr:chloride channel protein [Flavobacterium ichthyis]NBL65143.1 CBS domain-containing protein [Flavobacterium ichthyis]